MSTPRSPQAIWAEIIIIVTPFALLECDKCAIALHQWLNHRQIPHTILRLKTKRRSDLYIINYN